MKGFRKKVSPKENVYTRKSVYARESISSGISSLALSIAFGLAAMAATPAVAAEITANLQGVVSSAPSGTIVTARSLSDGSKVSANVRADGSYDIIGLRPGSYEVTFTAPNGKNQVEKVTLAIGTTAYVDGNLGDASKDLVVVRGSRTANIKTSEINTSISRTQMEVLPQNGRNFLNFAALAPGVVVSVADEKRQFRAGALTSDYVNVFIDGQSMKNQVLTGGVAGQDASRGNPFPQLAVQEFKVATSNFKAEYEQAGSAIITAVTKTGGNDFHGSLFGLYQSKGMIGQPYYDRDNPKPDYKNIEYGGDISGPIIRDKLFFYAAYEHREDQRPSDTVIMPNAATLGGNTALATALANEYNGSGTKDFTQDMYFGKLTWVANDKDTFDITYMKRDEGDARNFGFTKAYSAGVTQASLVDQGTLRWKHRDGDLLNEASLDYQDVRWGTTPISNGPQIILVSDASNPFGAALATFGGTEYNQQKNQKSFSFKNEMTYSGLEWNGKHIIKGGVKVANYEYSAYVNDRVIPTYYYLASTYVLGGTNNVPLAVQTSDAAGDVDSKNTQIGAYIQDDWTLNEHWTFNLGVRWDYETNMLNNNYKTPDEIATALRNHIGFNKAFGAENYISTGDNRESFKGAWQPRLGFSYDVKGDRETVIFGGYARTYDRTIYDYAQLEPRKALVHSGIQIRFPSDAAWNPAYFDNPEMVHQLAAALNRKGELYLLNNKTKVPYADTFSVGIRQRFGNIQTSATFSHQEAKDIFKWVLGNRDDTGVWCGGDPSRACDGGRWSNGLTGYGNLIVSTNDQRARSNAIYLTADKAYTKDSGYGWGVKLDLTKAESTGSDEALLAEWENADGAGWHPAPGVPKFNLVANFIYDLPWGIQSSGLLTLQGQTGQEEFIVYNEGGVAYVEHNISGYYQKDKIAYKQFDLSLSKEFEMPNGNTLVVRGTAVNVFDWVNRTYSVWGNVGGGLGAPWANPTPSHQPDRATTGPARSFQLGLQYKW